MSYYQPGTGAAAFPSGSSSSPYAPQQQQQQQQNVSAYGNSAPQQQYQQQQFQQQQTQNTAPNSGGPIGGGAPNVWNAASMAANIYSASANGGSDAIMDAGLQTGKELFNTGMSRFLPGANTFWGSLKYYFLVDNQFVKKKLKTILFPFLKRNWMRLKDDNSGGDAGGNGSGMGTGFVSPRGDENAPDLYIPSMGLCSYVLLSALVFGNSGSFSPDIIQDLLVSCTFTQFLEVSAIKVGYYFLQAPCSWLDMISFTGYKYVGLCINMICGLLGGYWFYNVALLWTASAVGYFMMKTFANNIPRITSAAGPKREFMVLGLALAQCLSMWWLGNTRHLK